MSKTISVRLDEEALTALRMIESGGHTRSEAIRHALIESAATMRTPEALRAEAARLAADPVNSAEVAEVQEFMESLDDPG